MRGWIAGLAALAMAGCSAAEPDAANEIESENPQPEPDRAAARAGEGAAQPGDAEAPDTGQVETAGTDESHAVSPPGRIVDCLIVTNSDDYEGPCRFFADDDGSFSLSLDDESPLVDAVTMVSVTILEPGEADVRGLTTGGINSRWGSAMRDAEDRACWNGADFTICAY